MIQLVLLKTLSEMANNMPLQHLKYNQVVNFPDRINLPDKDGPAEIAYLFFWKIGFHWD